MCEKVQGNASALRGEMFGGLFNGSSFQETLKNVREEATRLSSNAKEKVHL